MLTKFYVIIKLVILLRCAEMKTHIILVFLILATANLSSQEETKCKQIIIDGVSYVQELLKDNVDKPYYLAIDKGKDILYFSYGADVEKEEFITAYINLVTKDFGTIAGVNNGFSQTVDDVTHDVYIGGSDGIYRYKHGSKAERIAEEGTSIWHVYYNKILYYSTFPGQFFYTYDGEVTKFKELEDSKVDLFVIDNNVMYYTNADGLFKKVKEEEAILIKDFSRNDPRCLLNDDGEIYICLKDGVYKLNKESKDVDKVFNVTNLYGLAIDDDDNIIYSDTSNVYRLNKEKAC